MESMLPVLGIALSTFAAFCVWLTVRIVNRRERWAKRTAVGLVAAIIAYPFSAGPVLWIWVHVGQPDWLYIAMHVVYLPLGWGLSYCPEWLKAAYDSYSLWWFT